MTENMWQDSSKPGKAAVCAQCLQPKIVIPIYTWTGVNADGEPEGRTLDQWLCENCWLEITGARNVSPTMEEIANRVAEEVFLAANCRSQQIAKENLNLFIVNAALGRKPENRLNFEDFHILRDCSDPMPDGVLVQIGLKSGTSYADAVTFLYDRHAALAAKRKAAAMEQSGKEAA